MNIQVGRGHDDGKAVMGLLYVDGQFECYTLEPSATAKYPIIPAGTYPIQLLESPRFGEVTPHVQNVPGRSFIEIHPGNKPSDTEGCTLVGDTTAVDWVGSSRAAFQQLMNKLTTAPEGSISITFTDPVLAPDMDGEISV